MRACIWNCCVCCVFCATEARDTSDVGVELGKWRRVPAKLHSVMLHETDEKSDFVNFVFRMFVVRRYRPSVCGSGWSLGFQPRAFQIGAL